MPAGRRRGQEVGEVLIQSAAHGRQPRRARPQRLFQAVDRYGDDLVPRPERSGFGARVAAQAGPLGARHTLVRVGVGGLDEALRRCPAPLSTMGRGMDEDGAYFLAAAAAGRHAAALCRSATIGPLA